MTDNIYSLLNVTGLPSKLGYSLVHAQQNALDMLAAGHPKHDGKQDGPQTAENKMLMEHIARTNAKK